MNDPKPLDVLAAEAHEAAKTEQSWQVFLSLQATEQK